MRKRDLAILKDLERFRCMTRDDIINLHFAGLKNPVTCANTVLKRLRRDGHIEVNTDFQPYIYFLSPSPINQDVAKELWNRKQPWWHFNKDTLSMNFIGTIYFSCVMFGFKKNGRTELPRTLREYHPVLFF